jgi:hypothetical protein
MTYITRMNIGVFDARYFWGSVEECRVLTTVVTLLCANAPRHVCHR